MKLLNTLVLILGLISLPAYAEFNRIGNGSMNYSWMMTNAEKSNDWQGVSLTGDIPLGTTPEIVGQKFRVNGDVSVMYQKANDINTNYSKASGGLTFWVNNGWDKNVVSFAPYMRVGVTANSGNIEHQNQSYWGYALEPGIVVKYDQAYGLLGYFYENSFSNNDYAIIASGVTTGVGVNINKNLAVEAKYNMNRGSTFNSNTLVIGGVYKF